MRWSLDGDRILVDTESHTVWVSGQKRRVPPRAMAALAHMVERPGQVVSHDEFARVVWPEQELREPSQVANLVYQLRQLLADDGIDRPVITTEPTQGYRLSVSSTLAKTDSGAGERAEVLMPQKPAIVGRRVRPMLYFVAILAFSIGAAGLAGFDWLAHQGPLPPGPATPTRLETVVGTDANEVFPAVSADGDWLAFVQRSSSAGTSRSALIARAIDANGGQRVLFESTEHDVHSASWSPNSDSLVYTRSRLQDRTCEVVILELTTEQELVIDQCAYPWTRARWSPDGTHIVFTALKHPGAIRLYSVATGTSRDLREFAEGEWPPDYYAWHPDSRSILYSVDRLNQQTNLIQRIDLAGEASTVLVANAPLAGIEALPDGTGLVFASSGAATTELYRYHFDSDAPVLLRLPVAIAQDPSMDAQAEWLYFTSSNRYADIYEVSQSQPARPILTFANGYSNRGLQLSADGQRLLFHSNTNLISQIWMYELGERAVQLTQAKLNVSSPALSPDGRYLAYLGQCGENASVENVCVDMPGTGGAKSATAGQRDWLRPSWTLDSRHLLASPNEDNQWQVLALPVEGGAPIEWLPKGSAFARPVDAHRYVYFSVFDLHLHLHDRRNGDDRKLTEIAVQDFQNFDVDGGFLYYVARSSKADQLRRRSLDADEDELWAELAPGAVPPWSLAGDTAAGKVYLSVDSVNGDILRVRL